MLDRKEKVLLGGLMQQIHWRTDDEKKPVLLFLHGGPGVCNRHTILRDHSDLTDTFTIVTWDQRGSGGSYRGAKTETLTVDRLVEDARELVRFLCDRFCQEKIFIIGGSWGSELGTWLAYRYPEQLAAFVGFGQVVNGEKNELLSFQFALDAAKAAGDGKAVAALGRVGPPVMGVYKGGYDGMMVQRNIMMKYGGYSLSEKKRSYFRSFVVPVLFSGEYSPAALWGLAVGHTKVLNAMWHEVGATDFEKTCTQFQIPIFIFDGRHDNNTPAALVEHWFDMIRAPQKELIWFERSGHNPMGDEPERFKTLLRERLTAVAAKERKG